MVEFKYPFGFRLLHLWLIYVVAVGNTTAVLALRHSAWGSELFPSGSAFALRLLGPLLLLVLAEYTVFRRIPTAIRISHQRVSLVRLRPYAEFNVADVQSVQRNSRWIFKGWTKVTVRPGSGAKPFYISPDAEWHDALLQELGQAQAARHPRAARTFDWTIERIWFMRLACVGFGVGLAAMLLDMSVSTRSLTNSDLTFMALISLGFVFLIWTFAFRTPVRVEFADHRITFVMVFGRRIEVGKSDVLAVEKGLRLGRFRVPGSTGVFIKLRGRPKWAIQTYFIDYPELASRLASLVRRTGPLASSHARELDQ